MKKQHLTLLVLMLFATMLGPTLAKGYEATDILPVQTTRGAKTTYSITLIVEKNILHSAFIRVHFPYQFDPRKLRQFTTCELIHGNEQSHEIDCQLWYRTFLVPVQTLTEGEEITLIFNNIENPSYVEMSSDFIVETGFGDVVVTKDSEKGRCPFTKPPISPSPSLTVHNYENVLVGQGSSWTFQFTLSQTYDKYHTIRVVFPVGFSSKKVQCNITNIIDTKLKTRTFPRKNVFDCLNVDYVLQGTQKLILSGLVNPDYEMLVDGIEIHILQPNSLVVLEKIVQLGSILIEHKAMDTAITIPNKFRNNTITYIFEINMDSDFNVGDYFQFQFQGNWTFFIEDSQFIEGVFSNKNNQAVFKEEYDHPTTSTFYIKDFFSVSRKKQVAFYVSLRTPLEANFYDLTISAFRSHGGLVEKYEETLQINATTGYIRQMRLHPMQQAIKLPVGQTGPLEITLGLRNNLPKTDVLTFGKFLIKITPNLPLPDVDINGVIKCYFYRNIEAKNCTYDDSDPDFTLVTVFTPKDFNFQSSQVPFMITTEGYIDPQYEGITIDTLVKRYHFHIQFYTQYRRQPIPTEVVFGDWVPDSIPMGTFSCQTMTRGARSWDHITCTFTTPSEDLNEDQFTHIFRIEFTGSNPSYYGWHRQLGYSSNHVYPDYPCIGYGDDFNADPYIKCDLVTWTSGPYGSGLGKPYVNIYGFQFLPAGSQVTIQIPHIQRYSNYYQTQLKLSILQDTWGYQTDFITVYSQTINIDTTSYVHSDNDGYDEEIVAYTLTDSIINKITNITLDDYDFGTSGVNYVVFEVDQDAFEDIGREHHIQCGDHMCSKFNKPIQYFILHPESTLSQVESLTFPFIVTPEYAGDFQFRLRIYKNNAYIRHSFFNITIDPEQLDAPVFEFDPTLEGQDDLYPNTKQYVHLQFTTKNKLPASTSFIEIIFDNHFQLASKFCVLNTSATSADGRGIQCEVWQTSNFVLLENMDTVAAGTTFDLYVQMESVDSTATVAPTVSITTFWDVDKKVDEILNSPFTPTTVTNTNLETFTTFDVQNPQVVERKPTKGYFGDLIVRFKPRTSEAATHGETLTLTFTDDFDTLGSATNLPIRCEVNDVRETCSYTLTPFEVTIFDINTKLSTSSENKINITTEYLEHNGIFYPADQGKYLLKATIVDVNNTVEDEYVEQYVDILPEPADYFEVNYAHRDSGRHNIYTIEFRNGDDAVPAYNHGTTAGRIYIGFPTKDENNGNVFSSNLGFGDGLGTIIPCWFKSGPTYIAPVSGEELKCILRTSPFSPKYTYVQIINFDTLGANENVKIIMAKVMNPTERKVDINFLLQINTISVANKEQFTLYESYYNMFINMLSPSVNSISEGDSSSAMFEPGAKVGDSDKYINGVPYSGSTFSQGDWYIVDMNSDFPLNGNVGGCLSVFYEHCIVFKEINWMAVKIGNTTLIPLQMYVTQLPFSISRVNTYYEAFTFKSQRWAETITYTVTAANRWMELRGAISGFSFEVQGSHDKLNINEKDVEVLITFNVSHVVHAGGSIQIQFPNNHDLVPSIKPHCRSAVTMGSQLFGAKTGKPATNVQGDVGCLIQNDFSWVITSFDELPAGSQVKVMGEIDFPTEQTASLGMGYVATFGSTHSSNVFDHGRSIDFLRTDFPLEVNNITWNLDPDATLYRTQPLRVGHKGELTFKLKFSTTLSNYYSGGYIDISLWRYNTMGMTGGFSGPTSNMVCTITKMSNNERFGCEVTSASAQTYYYTYRIQSFENLPANNDYQITLTTQNGNANEGINFPTSKGVHKIELQMRYSSSNGQQVSKPIYVQVYGEEFRVANLISTVSLPDEPNMLLLEFIPGNTIATNQQFVIQIPTVSNNGQALFPADLGMGYNDYDDLKFDLYESTISSMDCKVYTGDASNHQPVKIVCSNFNTAITNSKIVRMGFWTRNPSTTDALAIPVQIYSYDQYRARKDTWSMIEAGIRVIPRENLVMRSSGNFKTYSQRQTSGQHFELTTRNSFQMVNGDLYIVKFNFDLRNEQLKSNSFKYNSGIPHTGDVIFMRNCRTIMLRVGGTALTALASGSNTLNARIQSQFYNPSIQLTSAESEIYAIAAYISTDKSEVIYYNDKFPELQPREMNGDSFVFATLNSNQYKGQREDYKLQFTYSTSSSASDMSLVKKISVQFPAFSSSDFIFKGTECIQHPDSNIEIQSCIIDPQSRTMWITPVQKSYINSNSFYVETKGLAIRNPESKTTINKNQFVFRYYTWESEDAPVLYPNSDDYVFFKQDSTYIASSTLSYSNTYYPEHQSVYVPEEFYTNQWEPASSDLGNNRMKTPFDFKFKAMTTFSNLENTNNFHQISLKFNSYYSHASLNQVSQDLYKYIPTCQLNGFRIKECSISGGKIHMKFKFPIANGEESSVRFSVLNPTNRADDGFYLNNLNNPVVTLPIEFFPYGGGNWYGEAEPFNTFHRVSGSYPQLGIYSASVIYGTQVYAKMNYLQFTLQFSRNDINGLVLEIPVVDAKGVKIYNDPTLLNLPSGAEYPCSVGIDVNVFCYYEKGSSSDYGRPTRIYITKFSIQSGNSLSLRMLFTNPDVIGAFPSFTFKAYGGSYAAPQLMGDEFMGHYKIIDPFKTYPDVDRYSTGSCASYPNRGLWNRQTVYSFYVNHAQNTGSYVVLQWRLNHETYGQISEYELHSSYIQDYFTISYNTTDRRVYLVKKLTSTYQGRTNVDYHQFGYLRQKHFLYNSQMIYLMKKPNFAQISCTVSESWMDTHREVNQYGTPYIEKLDVEDRMTAQTSWFFLSVYMGTPQNMLLSDDDPADFIVTVKFTANLPYSSFSSSTKCMLEQGVTSKNPLKPVTCDINTSTNQIYFRNVNKFTGSFLKFYFEGTTVTHSPQSTAVQIRAYANPQAWASSDGWALFRGTTGAYSMVNIYYTSGSYASRTAPGIPGYNSRYFGSSWVEASGYTKLVSYSSNQIRIKIQRGTNGDFSNVYRMTFRFYTERLTPSGCQSVSFSGNRYSSNFKSLTSCGASDRHFWAIYDFYSTGGNSWPYWYAGDWYEFTFNFNSVSGDVTSPAIYMFAHTTITWEQSIYYHSNEGQCGCCGQCCNQNCCIRETCGGWCGGFLGFCCGRTCAQWQCCSWYCCTPCSCRWYYSWGTFFLTGRTDPAMFSAEKTLISSGSIDLVSRQRNVQTELMLQANNFHVNVGPAYGTHLILHFDNGQSHPNNNPFPATDHTEVGAYIDCLCLASSSLSENHATVYSQPKCVRYIPSGMQPSIGIFMNVAAGQSLRCYFPGYLTSTATTRLSTDLMMRDELFMRAWTKRGHYWSPYISYNLEESDYNGNGLSGSLSINENSFWNSAGRSSQSRYYEINMTGYNTNVPTVYMSMYIPKPSKAFCNYNSFYFCRVYDSFVNRKFYVVAQWAGTTPTIRFNGTAYFPNSDDSVSSYHKTYIGWTETGSERYYHVWQSTRSTSSLAPANPTLGYKPVLFGSNLKGYSSTFLVSTNMNGKTLYSNKRNYGQFEGSFIQVIMSGFSNIHGCGATLSNRPRSFSHPFYCIVQSSNQLRIYAREDIDMTGTLYVTFNTQTIPQSCSYSVYLWDKYFSGSDNSRSVLVSSSFTRYTNYNLVQPTKIFWNRQAYYENRVSNAPIRIFLQHNYQYVYDYESPNNSDAIAVYYPGGISSSYTYWCLLREYPLDKPHLYVQYETSCEYYQTDTIRVKSIPSHVLNSEQNTYEIIIYRNNNGAQAFLTTNTADRFFAKVHTLPSLNSSTPVNEDFILVNKYQTVYPIVLNHIYILTREANVINSLYLSFTVNKAGTAWQYFEFEFASLGLSSFDIKNGEQIPCYLSADFVTISGKTFQPICKGYTSGIDQDSPLKIRVEMFRNFNSGTTFELAFDNFNNPSEQPLFLVPIDLRISFFDRTNNDVYTSYFPEIFASDSIDVSIPQAVGGSLARSNSARGGSGYQYINMHWPYSSNSGDKSEKLVLKMEGGITCCNAFSNFYLDTNRTSSFSVLWRDDVANMTVYSTPSISYNTYLRFEIMNVNNPYPWQKQTYEKLKKIELLFYDDYKTKYHKEIDQYDYSSYSQLSQFNVDTNLGSPVETRKSFYFHQNYPMTYDIEYTTSSSSYSGRKLDYTLLKFTGGVKSIEDVQIRHSQSPYIVNPVLQVKFYRDNSNYWCLKISGMDDASYNPSYHWKVRIRFYPNANTLSYTSTTYAANGEVQFSNSDSENIHSDGYRSSTVAPSTFETLEQRYTYNYYELQRQYMHADTGTRPSRLAFRFTTPYAIKSGEQFTIKITNVQDLYGVNTPNDLTCIIQPTLSTKTKYGVGLLAEDCTYTSGVYNLKCPVGGLQKDHEYTLSILEKNQTNSLFTWPTTPKRLEVELIYKNQLTLKFGDTYRLDISGLLSSFSVSHLTRRYSTYNMIGFTFTPSFTLPASSLVSPVTESVLEIELQSRYFANCLGVDSVFSGDGMDFQSGAYFSHYSSPAVNNANTRLMCGQYGESYTPVKLRVTDYGQMTASNSYYFRFPMITNPSSDNTPFVYKLRLLHYETNKHYPIVMGEYTYKNLEQVQTYSSSWQYTYISQSNDYVQKTMGLTIGYNYYNPPSGTEVLVKFKNNALKAFTSINTLTSLSNSNYGGYEYYPNINLCVFRKTTGTNDRSISLGSYPTSDDQQSYTISWMWAYPSKTTLYTSNFNPNGHKTNTLNIANAWTSSSISKISGSTNTNSMGVYRIAWSANYLTFPEGSYMLITLDGQLTILEDYCKEMSGFLPGTQIESSNLICRKESSDSILIAGYNEITTGTALSITLYLQVATNSITVTYPNARIIVYSSNNNKIIDAETNYYTLDIQDYGGYVLRLEDQMEKQITADISQQLDVKFRLASHTLTNGCYLTLDLGNWTVDEANNEGKIVWKYQIGNSIEWIPSLATKLQNNVYKVPVYENYSMTVNTDITLRIFHLLPDNHDGVFFPEHQWNYLKIQAYNSADAILEHQYKRVWIEPYEHASFQIDAKLDYSNANTMYEFTVTPNVTAADGDFIGIEFSTNDDLKSPLFDDTLGFVINDNTSLEIGCHEVDHDHVISDEMIKCELFAGDADNNIPAFIMIPINKTIAANTEIKFVILNLQNPAETNYPIAVTFKLMNLCENNDQNNPCTYYRSTVYKYFTSAPSVPSVNSYVGSLTFNPNLVSATSTQHTFSASYSIDAGDILKIIYYPEVPIPEICTITSSNGVCYSFPLDNTIIIVANTSQSSTYSFTLSGMTNLYQSQSSNKPYTEIWDISSKTIVARFFTDYWVSHITSDPTSGNPLSISFTPTLTPDYQLKYDFNNIARIEISYLLQNQHIQMIYVTAPSEITFAGSYCNATMESTTAEATPYPYRFQCTSIGSRSLTLKKQDNFPQWQAGFINKKIVLYLKYTIEDWKTGSCSNWQAQAYTTSSTNSMYRVSSAVGNFPIIEYMSPYIYKINFPTEAFSKRTCRTNGQCMFYGYLLPSTEYSDTQLCYMVYTLPEEFKYSNLKNYDSCVMEEKNDDYNPVSCTASRNDSDLRIKFDPDSYNHNYKLVSIDTSQNSKLFTAPALPGTHYQMGVDLYSCSDVLMESMKVNLTTVYGELLQYDHIQIDIPKDANYSGLFQFAFRVGSTSIVPSYENSASRKITSAIEFIFSKSFESDLGTGLKAGDKLAAQPIQGLTFNTLGKLTCRIYPSYSTTTYPTIICTGYDKVKKNTDVVIQIDGLKTLDVNTKDYIKIGVSLTYFNYGGVKGYIYEPTGKVVGDTTAMISPYTYTFSIDEQSSNFVGELANYAITGTFASGFSNIKDTDYIVVEFDKYGFEGYFNQNEEAEFDQGIARSFGISQRIYCQPSSTISSASFDFELNKMINTAYSFEYKMLGLRVYTLVDGKINAEGTAQFEKFSKPSKNVSAIITEVDSNYGGDSGIKYYFQFKLNSYLPADGVISIKFPEIYESLTDLKSSCRIYGLLAKTPATCEIINSHLLVIRANGYELDQSASYQFILTDITNPNQEITEFQFEIKTFYSPNIYKNLLISTNTFDCPDISIMSVKECDTFEVELSANNAFESAQYHVSLTCPSYIKEGSHLRLYLDWHPEPSKDECESDSDSLFTEECSIKRQYKDTKQQTFMSLYLREISPQKLISLQMEIPNGKLGTYSIVSEISYKGFTYLSTVSNDFFISSDEAQTLKSRKIKVKNYPKNRKYDSIYTIRMPNPEIEANALKFVLPDNITQGTSTSLACNYLPQNFNENYFNLLLLGEENIVECSLTGNGGVRFNNIDKVLEDLGSDDFLRLSIRPLKNADSSTRWNKYIFKFFDTTSTSKNMVAKGSTTHVYQVSENPVNIQFDSIAQESNKYFVLTQYTMGISTVNDDMISINGNTKIGVIIHFPNEYKAIWQHIPVPNAFIIDLGSDEYETQPSLVNGTLLAKFKVKDSVDFNQITIKFDFRNPHDAIECEDPPIFKVSILNFKMNSIIAETLSNNINCPEFESRLYQVNISGNIMMEEGKIQEFTIKLEKPAKYLKITPTVSTPAISFEPSEILFENYESTEQSFKIKISQGITGNFPLIFQKEEQGGIYYNDIQDENITVVSSSKVYSIDFNEVDLKSAGRPIPLVANLERESAKEFTLLYSYNCSKDYVFNPRSFVTIPAGSKTVEINLRYKGSEIPKMCVVEFELSSQTTQNYVLKTSKLYIAGSLSIDKEATIAPMRLRISKTEIESEDVGFTVLDQPTTHNRPEIYEIEANIIGANSGTLTVSSSEPGTIYWTLMKIGTKKRNVNRRDIYNKQVPSGILYGSIKTGVRNELATIQSQLTIRGMKAQQEYLLGLYLNSTIGNSFIAYKQFETDKTTNGGGIKFSLTCITDESEIIQAFSNVLRIKEERIAILTYKEVLYDHQINYQSSIMNKRRYIYDLVIGPDPEDDTKNPYIQLTEFKENEELLNKMSDALTCFSKTDPMSVRKIIMSKPKFRQDAVTIQSKNHESATVKIGFWESSDVSAVLVPKTNEKLLSNQVIEGYDAENNAVDPEHFNNGYTNEQGNIEFEFTLLEGNTEYCIYTTAECILPYTPRVRMPDEQVEETCFKTEKNLNLKESKDQLIEEIAKLDERIAKLIEAHLRRMQRQMNLNKNRNTSTRTRKVAKPNN